MKKKIESHRFFHFLYVGRLIFHLVYIEVLMKKKKKGEGN